MAVASEQAESSEPSIACSSQITCVPDKQRLSRRTQQQPSTNSGAHKSTQKKAGAGSHCRNQLSLSGRLPKLAANLVAALPSLRHQQASDPSPLTTVVPQRTWARSSPV